MERVANAINNHILITNANGQAVDSALDIEDLLLAKPTTYGALQLLVRSGRASRYYEIGDEILVHNSDKNADVIFKVMHMFDGNQCGALKLVDPNLNHGMILQVKDVLYYNAFPFSPKQAMYKCPDGLAAGTYHFTIKEHSWVSGDVNKIIQFTLANNIPAGGQLLVNQSYNVSFVGATISSYASPESTTVIETVTMSEGSSGTDLGELKNSINGNFNSCQRALLGDNRWKHSFERQMMNSGLKGFWTAQTEWDRPVAWADSHDGLLASFDKDFVDVLAEVDVTTVLNTVSDGGGTEVTRDKFFLPNRLEMYMTAENASEIGVAWDYYKNNSDLPSPGTGADSNRIKYEIGTTTARYYWMRTPSAGDARYVRSVDTDGSVNGSSASYDNGCAPACVIA